MNYDRLQNDIFAVLLVLFLFVSQSSSQELTADVVIAKHIASIGTPEMLVKSKQRMAIGTSEFIRRDPAQTSVGRTVLASNGTDFAFFATFDLSDYSMERIGIFSNKINLPLLQEGRRSPLGSYLLVNDKILIDRIFGGPIFATWYLLDRSTITGKFDLEGKKKIGEREAWVVSYKPKPALRGGSTLKLYFDAENFHLLRTALKLTEPDRGFYEVNGKRTEMNPSMAGNGSSLQEDFDDYKETNGLTLPHKYKIDLTLNGAAGTAQFKWNFNIVEYRIVKDFGPGFFSFSA